MNTSIATKPLDLPLSPFRRGQCRHSIIPASLRGSRGLAFRTCWNFARSGWASSPRFKAIRARPECISTSGSSGDAVCAFGSTPVQRFGAQQTHRRGGIVQVLIGRQSRQLQIGVGIRRIDLQQTLERGPGLLRLAAYEIVDYRRY